MAKINKRKEYEKIHGLITGQGKKTVKTKPAVKSGQKESAVLKSCMIYLKCLTNYGVMARRNNTGFGNLGSGHLCRYGIKNAADIICSINGKYVEIECKHGSGGNWSAEQQTHADEVKRNGGYYFVVHSKEELIEAISPLLPNLIDQLDK